MKSRRTNCRIWWPDNLSITTSQAVPSFSIYFGWFICSRCSLDIVVAFSLDESALSSLNLQSILQQTNGKMPVSLQDKSKFSLLGYSGTDSCVNGILPSKTNHVNKHTNPINHIRCFSDSEFLGDQDISANSCGCNKVDGLPDQFRHAFKPNSNWFQLVYMSNKKISRKYQLLPRLHHLHWNGQTVTDFDLHTIIYEIPVFGGHHYSLSSLRSYDKVRSTTTKKPSWVADLNRKQAHIDLDVVIVAVNCVNASKISLQGHLPPKRSILLHDVFCMLITYSWTLFALFSASFATFLYGILQWGNNLLGYVPRSYVLTSVKYIFHETWTVIEIRCYQFLYWPIFLQHYVLRQSCVEYMEKMALCRNSTLSVLVVDLLLGTLFGIALWSQSNYVFLSISNLSVDITNNLLRSGCVWLMGNPAGFKLNTELARVLGMMSLNIIQIWSTIWSVMGFLFVPMSRMVASFAMLFGFTVAAALIIDMISLLTRHLFLLHWAFSLVYSYQLQALAALWRLFRGQKWNPLRFRLDSYDYTVEQHVVGTLLFTPLLLLLPTTSAFYTFFSIINTTISFICIVIEAIIYLIHATPYNQIITWLVRRRRFPSGIWLQFGSDLNTTSTSCFNGPLEPIGSSFQQPLNDDSLGGSTILVSSLQSNYMDLGEVAWSNYEDLYSSIIRSSVALSAFGILTGKRIPSTLGIIRPPKLPWIEIPCEEFWSISYDAVLECRGN